jgi:TetR/AcrR family tetracycline transcriptional repressor
MTHASARPRPELSRERILHAALELIDRKGLAALNMRDLGVALEASTMSVYRHFRSKAELLGAVVDRIVEAFAPPRMKGGWQDQAIAISLRVRRAMIAHPELADLIGRELRRSPTSLRVNTAIIERLGAAGVPATLLPETYWAISCYTTGYALLEAQTYRHRRRSSRKASPADRVRKLAGLLDVVEGVPPDTLRGAAVVLARPLDEKQFLFGLECLIRGLEGKFEAAEPAHAEA